MQCLEEVVPGEEIYQGIQPGIVRRDQPLAIPSLLVEEEATICRDTFKASVSH